jgi:hypothetical protein
LVRPQAGQPNKEKKMTEQKIEVAQDTWAGAMKEFVKQLGGVSTLLIIVMSIGQCSGCIDIYRLLGK